MWHHSKKLAASTLLRSKMLCIAKKIITCLDPSATACPMNTDNILQKQRLETTQTRKEEREAGVLRTHLLGRDLGDSQCGNFPE